MIGTGHGGVENLYNTCFVIQNDLGDFLVDTGGSIEIIKRLKHFNINFKKLTHIFISHCHTDHLFGLIWMLKKLSIAALHHEIDEKINIYCHDEVELAIRTILKQVLPEKLVTSVMNILDIHILENHSCFDIHGINYTFFDIKARGMKQFGFECNMDSSKFLFLGDETLNEELYDKVRNADYVMHEAFCLDSEEEIFHAYEKNHSTVKSSAITMEKLGVKNLILYHTEESHPNKSQLYLEEGKKYFSGNLIVPNDLDIIEINDKGGKNMEIVVKTIENDLDYLRQKSKEVDLCNDDYKKVIQVLDDYCRHDDNIMAIASIQLGIPLRLVYLKKTDLDHLEDDGYNESKVLINPVIKKKEGLTRYWEACASCLDNTALVERPYKIEVEYYDAEKRKHCDIFEGFPSTVLSHEMDHLDGILHMDKAIKLVHINREERKQLREKEPYKVLRRIGKFE